MLSAQMLVTLLPIYRFNYHATENTFLIINCKLPTNVVIVISINMFDM